MKLRPRDIISHQGKDYVVEGLLTYRLGGKIYRLARIVDGELVRWLEPPTDDADDRVLIFDGTSKLDIATPPPPTIAFAGRSFLPRFSGQALVEIAGKVPERLAGPCEVWRYRAAGDMFLQIEAWSDRVVTLLGESVHKDMVEVLPSP